jgi:hypothetical protein
VVDANANVGSTTLTVDTATAGYVVEAEDYDYTTNGVSGLFFPDPQTNAYLNASSTLGVDYQHTPGTHQPYRPSGLETEVLTEKLRAAYNNTGATDYDVGYNNGGDWANYTRNFAPNTYNVYLRASDGNGNAGGAGLDFVTGGNGTAGQTTTNCGSFTVPPTGAWGNYQWIPLLDASSNLVALPLGGVQTVRLTQNGSDNVNFIMFVPLSVSSGLKLTATPGNNVVHISYPTQLGQNYQLQYKTNITDATWQTLGTLTIGTGGTVTNDSALFSSHLFYQVQIQ